MDSNDPVFCERFYRDLRSVAWSTGENGRILHASVPKEARECWQALLRALPLPGKGDAFWLDVYPKARAFANRWNLLREEGEVKTHEEVGAENGNSVHQAKVTMPDVEIERIPDSAAPLSEIEWIAAHLSQKLDQCAATIMLADAPSKAAVNLLLDLQKDSGLRAQFWMNMWAKRLSVAGAGRQADKADQTELRDDQIAAALGEI